MVVPFHHLRRDRPGGGYTFGITLELSPVVQQEPAALLHPPPEDLAGPVQPDLGGAGGEVQDGGDFRQAQVPEFTQGEDGSVGQGQR